MNKGLALFKSRVEIACSHLGESPGKLIVKRLSNIRSSVFSVFNFIGPFVPSRTHRKKKVFSLREPRRQS